MNEVLNLILIYNNNTNVILLLKIDMCVTIYQILTEHINYICYDCDTSNVHIRQVDYIKVPNIDNNDSGF